MQNQGQPNVLWIVLDQLRFDTPGFNGNQICNTPCSLCSPARASMFTGGVWNGPTEATPSHFLANYTIDMLDEYAGSNNPLFITCNFWGPHPPYPPSNEFYNTHDREKIPPWDNFADPLTDKPMRVMHERNDFYRARPGSWEEWRELVGLCYDCTSMIYAEIGRILDKLDSLGIRDQTAVMLTADHGDMIGSHNQLFDKGFICEEAHHTNW